MDYFGLWCGPPFFRSFTAVFQGRAVKVSQRNSNGKEEKKRPAGEVSKQMMNLNEKSLAGFYVAMHREEAAGGR